MKTHPVFYVALGGAFLLWAFSRTNEGGTVVAKIGEALGLSPRGIRNNNPGNIERTLTLWQGMNPDQSGDERFVVFASPAYGVRAMARIIRNYMGRGLTSVRAIINTWAPPIENDTDSYVNAIASSLGVNADEPLDYDSAIIPLLKAITQHENGMQPYADSVFASGVALERST